jgi:two-component system, OmpR family, phosphate regulon response regulator PhoB
MPNILIVDDEPHIVELISTQLARENVTTLTAEDGISALRLAREQLPDLIVLDLMLPGRDGISICRELRREEATRRIPIIMLTAKSQLQDKITGLESGADDYLTKPFSTKELILRIRGLLRRNEPQQGQEGISSGPFRLDFSDLRLYLDGQAEELTVTEFRLMAMFLQNPGKVLRREELLRDVWGYNDEVQTRTLDTHVKRLRIKLGSHGNKITTERGTGYCYMP